MAVCKKCGKILKDDEMFCSACGTPVGEAPAEVIPPTEEVMPVNGGKKKKGWIIAACILAGLAVAGTVLFFVFRKSEKDKIVSAFQKTLTAENYTEERRAITCTIPRMNGTTGMKTAVQPWIF